MRCGLNTETLSYGMQRSALSMSAELPPVLRQKKKVQSHLGLVQSGLLQNGANTNNYAWCLCTQIVLKEFICVCVDYGGEFKQPAMFE